jgi:hypothetical protein
MTTDFEKIEKVNELLEKEAFIGSVVGAAAGALGKGVWKAGLTTAKNPVMAFNALDVGASASRTSKAVGDSKMQAAMNITAPSGATF